MIGARIRFNIKRGIRISGNTIKIYKDFILVNTGKYNICINKGDVIDRDFLVEVKINKKWTRLNRDMVGM